MLEELGHSEAAAEIAGSDSELQSAIVGELSDVASAFGNVDQSYSTSGWVSYKASGGIKSRTYGSSYYDVPDECDCDENLTIVCDDPGEKTSDN